MQAFNDSYGRNPRMEELTVNQLCPDKLTYFSTHRILVLGERGSGKSTFVKQMQLIHGDGFSDIDKFEVIQDINASICDALLTITGAMKTLIPPIYQENPDENEARLNFIREMTFLPDSECPPEFYEYAEILWQDKGIQEAAERSNEYELPDSARYFLDRIFIIKRHDYLPNEEDLLRFRSPAQGIVETRFQMDDEMFHIFDIGDPHYNHGTEASTRCRTDLRATIYVVDCSAFNKKLWDEDETELHLSIRLFSTFWKNLHKRTGTVILLLNKLDILEQKIESGRSHLDEYFPEYPDYQPPLYVEVEQEKDAELTRAKCFIRNKFMEIATPDFDEAGINFCYPQFTCALDTNCIRKAFDNCRDLIELVYMNQIEEKRSSSSRCVIS